LFVHPLFLDTFASFAVALAKANKYRNTGPVVQLNRTSDSGSESRGFESLRGHKIDDAHRQRRGHFLFGDAMKAFPVPSMAETNKKCKQRQLRHHQSCRTLSLWITSAASNPSGVTKKAAKLAAFFYYKTHLSYFFEKFK
jgi:hypothetical protein